MQIERTSPRALFAQLVASALGKAPIDPSPMAIAYLIELLDERVRQPDAPEPCEALAEMLLAAQQDRGAERIRRMRGLGDRALFAAGFFGDSLARSVVDIDYYRVIGCSAYDDVAAVLAGHRSGPWPYLYAELATHFGEFVDVLAEVGDRSRNERPENLLRLYERYLRTGSPRDRDRLVCIGHLPPERSGRCWWQ